MKSSIEEFVKSCDPCQRRKEGREFMAFRAVPNSVKGFSPFYLLHGREMQLPNNDNLKAHCASSNNSGHDSRLENLKASLRTAYELVAKANRKSQQTNKQYYDRRSKTRHSM
jgi:hypothetical protein